MKNEKRGEMVIINQQKLFFLSSKDLKKTLLLLMDVRYSPLVTLQENMATFFDIVEEFCENKRERAEGTERAVLTREINSINRQREKIACIESRSVFVEKYYDLLLSLENKDILRGFGIGNRYGDKVQGNPEAHRVSRKY